MSENPRRRRPQILTALALIIAGPISIALSAEPITAPAPVPTEGEPAVLYPVQDLGGEPVDLSLLLKGKVGLFAFWATWCLPCVEEIPRLREIARSYRDRGAVVVGIGLGEAGETPAKQHHLAARQLVNYQLVFDNDGWFQAAYNVRSLPYNVLVGADGRIRWQGGSLPDDLESRIQALLAQAGGGSGD